MGDLTARFVESVKGEPGRRSEYADGVAGALVLRVGEPKVDPHGRITAAGAKSWTVRYRNAAGQHRRVKLGGYPALSLKDARAGANGILAAVAKGHDVAHEKQAAKRKARLERSEKPQTLAALWAIYERDVLPGKRPKTAAFYKWLWSERLAPRLGAQELASLDRASVRAALKSIGANAPVTANRSLALVRHMLSVAVVEEYITASPLAQMGALYPEQSRERVLNDAELRTFWKAADAAPAREDIEVSARMAAALKLVLLTGARAGDVAGLHAREIDAASKSWSVPASRFKTKRAHVIPLSPQAWVLLHEVFGSDDPAAWAGFAFPHARDASKGMERASLTRAMKRIVTDAQLERVTPHDLRRTAATYLASERIGAAPHVVSAVLGHQAEGPAATQVYNRHRYDAEKRVALEAWGRLVMQIARGAASVGADVMPISRPRVRRKSVGTS
jgi:integrase